MPNYDYKCECGDVFEARISIADRKTAVHDGCGKTGKQVILTTPLMRCDPMDSGFPDAYNAWADRHEKGQR